MTHNRSPEILGAFSFCLVHSLTQTDQRMDHFASHDWTPNVGCRVGIRLPPVSAHSPRLLDAGLFRYLQRAMRTLLRAVLASASAGCANVTIDPPAKGADSVVQPEDGRNVGITYYEPMFVMVVSSRALPSPKALGPRLSPVGARASPP